MHLVSGRCCLGRFIQIAAEELAGRVTYEEGKGEEVEGEGEEGAEEEEEEGEEA